MNKGVTLTWRLVLFVMAIYVVLAGLGVIPWLTWMRWAGLVVLVIFVGTIALDAYRWVHRN